MAAAVSLSVAGADFSRSAMLFNAVSHWNQSESNAKFGMYAPQRTARGVGWRCTSNMHCNAVARAGPSSPTSSSRRRTRTSATPLVGRCSWSPAELTRR
jgi:hypothetical protein